MLTELRAGTALGKQATMSPGDIIAFGPGNWKMDTAITMAAGCSVYGKEVAPILTFPKINGIRIPKGAKSCGVQNLFIDTAPVEDEKAADRTAAVFVEGDNATITDITQVGAGKVLEGLNAKGLTAHGLYANNGRMRDKGIYLAGCNNAVLEEVWLLVPTGAEHGLRANSCDMLVIGGTRKLRAGPGYGRSVFIQYNSESYPGVALKLTTGATVNIDNLIYGKVGLGPLKQRRDEKQPGWEDDKLESLLYRCDIFGYGADGAITIESGTNLLARGCNIHAINKPVGGNYDLGKLGGGPCIDIGGDARPKGETTGPICPAAQAMFIDCHFRGAKLLPDSKKPLAEKYLNFINCTLIGPDGATRKIGQHGAVIA